MTRQSTAPLRSNCHSGARAMVVLATLLASLALVTPASAAAPEFLLQIPADNVESGSAAGQLNIPQGMATDPATGHLYISDHGNNRISEFTAWGAFVKAWGWDVAPEAAPGDTPSDEFEICTATCKAGSTGVGAGQFQNPFGITLDAAGDVYVSEDVFRGNRVQKFSPVGQFLLMFGGGVNQGPTNPGNLCTAQHITEGDTCGAGASGGADGWFSNGSAGSYLTYNPATDSIFVGDKDRIQEFETDGSFEDKIDFEGDLQDFDGKSVDALSSDPDSGDLYFAIAAPDVYRLDPDTDTLLDTLEVEQPGALAVDAAGSVYVVDDPLPFGLPEFEPRVLGFDSGGASLEGLTFDDEFAAPPATNPPSSGGITGLATNVAGPGSGSPGSLYVDYVRSVIGSDSSSSYLNAYGQAPIAFEDPPLAPPEIKAQYAVSVDTDGALLKAQINPRFWPDTTYYVQYGTEQCVEGGWEAACVQEAPVPPALLTPKSANAFLTTAGVFLGDLVPDTTYRYRFTAQSTGSGGEEVIGAGGKPGVPGAEASFNTFPVAGPPSTECPNQAFRTGPSAKLPDCRAYEMVSPLEKGSGDIQVRVGGLHQSSTSGTRLTYSSATAFGEGKASPSISQFLAQRDPEAGWLSQPLASPRTRELDVGTVAKLQNEFKLFSPDLCMAWLRPAYDPPLAEGAVPAYYNLYRRQNCGTGAGGYEALTTVVPPLASPSTYVGMEPQGLSADGSRAIYTAADRLTEDALSQPATCGEVDGSCTLQLYEHTQGGQLRYVCILPNGTPVNPATHACYAGTALEAFGKGTTGSFQNAISADGERIFWTAKATPPTDSGPGPGRIYLRIGGTETLKVSESVSGANAFFWGAADDGARAVFEMSEGANKDNLYTLEVDAEEEEKLIAKGVLGVLGISEDARRAYFASTEAIAGSGQNGEGDEAVAGEPNLYLYEAGEPPTRSFIGALSDADVGGLGALSPIASAPSARTSRISADGLHAAFMSTAPLTDYDNLDADTGKPVTEVFLYDAGGDELRCVSCNPSGARPSAGVLLNAAGSATGLLSAGQIPGFERALYPSRLLSGDGTRLFFESHEALLTRDTNGVQDVYQWEEPGTGDCDEADSTFDEEAGGCVDLVSSGQSPTASSFLDASPDGEDVFFSTLSGLLPQDYGLVDVYDARVSGGFPQPTTTPGCEGEACQGPLVAPDDPTPASSSFEGAGNVTEAPRPVKCAKGRRAVRKAGKTRCVRKPRKAKRANRAKRANHKGRAAR